MLLAARIRYGRLVVSLLSTCFGVARMPCFRVMHHCSSSFKGSSHTTLMSSYSCYWHEHFKADMMLLSQLLSRAVETATAAVLCWIDTAFSRAVETATAAILGLLHSAGQSRLPQLLLKQICSSYLCFTCSRRAPSRRLATDAASRAGCFFGRGDGYWCLGDGHW
jgi:hypothetical protein